MSKVNDLKVQMDNLRKMGLTEAEIKDVLAYDDMVDHARAKDRLEHDLPPEKEKEVKKMTSTGTKKTEPKKKPNYEIKPRERKKNPEKSEIIAKTAEILQEMAENVVIVKPEGEISFNIGENEYSIKLTAHRKAKN